MSTVIVKQPVVRSARLGAWSSVTACFCQKLRRGVRSVKVHRLAIFVLSAVIIWFASVSLRRLSGSALWIPTEWRSLVGIIGPLVGLTAFGFVRFATPRKTTGWHYVVAGAAMCAAVFLVVVYVVLCARCVRNAQFEDAFWDEFKIAGRESDQPSSGSAAGEGRVALPPFLDYERSQVYLPLVWSDDASGYFRSVGLSEAHRAGLESPPNGLSLLEAGFDWSLQREPMRVVGFLQGSSSGMLAMTTVVFMIAHLLILGVMGVAIGATATPLETMVGEASGLAA